MRRLNYSLPVALVTLAVIHLLFPAGGSRTAGQSKKYMPVTKYDPKRDAAVDIQDAIGEAQRTNRRILLEVGGEWCSWCHTLDTFFDANTDLLALRDKNFVTVKINFSQENENKEVLARYGEILAYPHILVLDSNGKLLQSQGTGVLESGKSYDLEKLTAFLRKWAPSR
jgi:thioredoxin-related protein